MKDYVDGVVNVNPHYFKEVIRSILKHNKVEFTFEKKDGTLREAEGTCNVIEAIKVDETAKPKGTGRSEPDHLIKYYDLEKKGWRSFQFHKLREILSIKPIESVYVDSATHRINEINARLLEITKERKKIDNKKRKIMKKLNETDQITRTQIAVVNSDIVNLDNAREELNEESTNLRLELKELKV